MNTVGRSSWSVFLVASVFLSGCSPNAATPSKPAPQPQGQAPSPPPRSSGGSAGGGAVQAVRGAVKRVGDENDLRQFALAYTQEALANGRGPSSLQEIRTSLTPKMAKAFEPDGDYIVNWGVPNPSSSTIVAYARDTDMYGKRLVAKGDGSVVRMAQEEFDQAKSRR